MKPVKARYFVLVLLLLGNAPARPAAAEEPLRVGVAETDITPPTGFPVAGYYHERLATATHDPLKAKAIVFSGAGEQAALVVCDLTGIAVDLSAEVRRRAAARTKIPATNIVVTGTHSHTAPDYSRDLYEYLSADPTSAAKSDQPYSRKLIDGIVEAIVTAQTRAKPATVDAGSAEQKIPVSFNRRFVMKDGSVRTWMRLDEPGVVRPAGPIDPEIGIALIRSAESRLPLALLSNFALHLDTVGGTLWSADYPFYIEQSLRQALDPNVISIFSAGCCGDINHVDPSRKDRNKTDLIGRSLAKTIESGMPHLGRVKQPTLRTRSATVRIPLQEVTAEQLARARAVLADAKAGKKMDFEPLVTAYKSIMLDQLRNKAPSMKAADFINWGLSHTWAGVGGYLPVEVQVICLGEDLAIVCLPGEIFVELGLAIKRLSPFRTTLVVELSNSVEMIYVPTRAAYAGGGYEVINSALQAGSGEMLVETALRLLHDVARGRRP